MAAASVLERSDPAPADGPRTLWLAATAGVVGTAALAAILSATAPAGSTRAETGGLAVALGVAFAFLAWSARFPARATPLNAAPPTRLLATWASAAAAAAMVWVLLGFALARGLAWALDDAAIPGRFRERALLLFWLAVLGYLLAAAVHYLNEAALEARRARLREAEARTMATEAELRALRQQVSPHFLFNCLNAISALVGREPDAARSACLDLADLLRQTLRLGARDTPVELREELEVVDRYLALEGLRFGPRLRVERGIEDEALGAAIPALLLLPLVENAVTHGVAPRLEGGSIRLGAGVRGDFLAIEIENSREPANPTNPPTNSRGAAGVGLAGSRRRLALFAPSRGGLEVLPSGDRFLVRIHLPFQQAPR